MIADRSSLLPADPACLRRTTAGEVIGGCHGDGVRVWHGIPYAAPPVGALRWRAPRPALAWNGIRNATAPRAAAVQVLSYSDRAPDTGIEGDIVGSEDCLTLTVWAPADGAASGHPVLVWFHGGGNVAGDPGALDASRLVRDQSLVIVCVTHRLGQLGWFMHDALAGAEDSAEDRSGNFATLDQIAALRWIADHIAVFGGNPDRVTIAGQSSGGWNVRALLCSPLARGLFHGAIIQGVGGYQLMSQGHARRRVDDPEGGHPLSSGEMALSLAQAHLHTADLAEAQRFLDGLGREELGAFFRNQSVARLFDALRETRRRNARVGSSEAMTSRAARVPPLLFDDGHVVTAHVQSPVPLLLGANRDEDRAFLSSDPRLVSCLYGVGLIRNRERYDDLASALAALFWSNAVHDCAEAFTAAGMPTFCYRFDWSNVEGSAGVDLRSLLGAGHGMELPLLFGTCDLTRDVRTMRHLYNPATSDFASLSAAMMGYWGSFVRAGVPLPPAGGLPEWPMWNGDAFLALDGQAAGNGIVVQSGSRSGEATLHALARHMVALPQDRADRLLGDLRSYPNTRLQQIERLAAIATSLKDDQPAARGVNGQSI